MREYINIVSRLYEETSTLTIDQYGAECWRNEFNRIHREDGPAVIYPNGEKEWWINGYLLTFFDLSSYNNEKYKKIIIQIMIYSICIDELNDYFVESFMHILLRFMELQNWPELLIIKNYFEYVAKDLFDK